MFKKQQYIKFPESEYPGVPWDPNKKYPIVPWDKDKKYPGVPWEPNKKYPIVPWDKEKKQFPGPEKKYPDVEDMTDIKKILDDLKPKPKKKEKITTDLDELGLGIKDCQRN